MFETPNNKIFPFNVENKIFNFTKEEAYLISPKGYSFILEHFSPFLIFLPSDSKYQNIKSEDLIEAFEQFSLLFSTLTQININQSNVLVFDYLSNVLKNEYITIFVGIFQQNRFKINVLTFPL
jgi:hypothetical protein